MVSSGIPHASAQRARTKTPDFSELFRSAPTSRHSSRTGAGIESSSSSIPLTKEKPVGTKATNRRSVLPFLGRKKPEQHAVPAMPDSAKSIGSPAYPVTPVNPVRRSFVNGHAVLMITPPPNGQSVEPPLPAKIPSMDAPPLSLGSKLAAHFTPLRSSSKSGKARFSMLHKSAPPSPTVPSPTALSPPLPERRTPSIESQHSSMRSTTPRPLRAPCLYPAEHGDEDDFSDLFTIPDKPNKPQPSLKSASTTSVHIRLTDSPERSGEFTPTTPLMLSGSSLQFPVPPSTATSPRLVLTEKSQSRYSSELASLSSQGSGSPKRSSPIVADDGNSDLSSQDERQSLRYRTISISGSDTDTSRANGSIRSANSFKLTSAFLKPPSMKPKLLASSGPPPSAPLPSPPLSPNPSGLGPRSAPITSPNRVAPSRPRANTLLVTSNLVVPGHMLSKSKSPLPPRSSKVDVILDGTLDELREALLLQRRRNIQLQDYMDTMAKCYEDDRMAMTRTIEKLERNIRKKTREIEGLRWLVIHNGAVSNINAAVNLARPSFSIQDRNASDGARRLSSLPSSPMTTLHRIGSSPHLSGFRQEGANIPATLASSLTEIQSETSSSAVSLSTSLISEVTGLMTPTTSVIPERVDIISRAERQKMKEERRASKALRRISAVSALAMLDHVSSQPFSADIPIDTNFDPKQSMDEVMEKLQPFRHT